MKDRLHEALKLADADYCEVRFEESDGTQIVYRGDELDSADSRKTRGGIVRACVKGGWGTATFDSLDAMETQVKAACQGARLVGRETTRLAPNDAPDSDERVARMQRDFRGVSLDDKLALARGYNDIIRSAHDAIQTSIVQYAERFRTVHFASSDGAYYREDRPVVVVAFVAVARDGSLVQQAHDSVASADSFDDVAGLDEKVHAVAGRAANLLKAPKPPGGPTTVVLDPRLAGVFCHEAFGHLSEADFLYENPKMRELMHLGRTMGVEQLNIVDDSSMQGTIATRRYDDEGTPTGKTYLIRNGKLAGHLHSRETAAKMGARPTGNARAIDKDHAPIVRMTNTYIENGDKSFEALIAGIDDGIYACNAFGGQTMMEMFTFSAGYGYRIENGQVGDLVRDVVLTGNVFQTLNHIDALGNDGRIINSGGGCGKGGQSPLPVTFGSPHLRIRDVVVGGQ
ncbi:MAG: TldD/PmbA family protein [Phycisphaerae bacterium]